MMIKQLLREIKQSKSQTKKTKTQTNTNTPNTPCRTPNSSNNNNNDDDGEYPLYSSPIHSILTKKSTLLSYFQLLLHYFLRSLLSETSEDRFPRHSQTDPHPNPPFDLSKVSKFWKCRHSLEKSALKRSRQEFAVLLRGRYWQRTQMSLE